MNLSGFVYLFWWLQSPRFYGSVCSLACGTMSLSTIRKLRRESGGQDAGYILLPPKNWLESEEKAAGGKILYFSFRLEGNGMVLEPVFEAPSMEQPRNSSPEEIEMMMRQGTLFGRLRDFRKGQAVFRVVKVPRSWVRSEEIQRNRRMIALRLTPYPNRLVVEPIFGERLHQQH
jgi:hypothetical protein